MQINMMTVVVSRWMFLLSENNRRRKSKRTALISPLSRVGGRRLYGAAGNMYADDYLEEEY